MQKACVALAGLIINPHLTQGFGRFAAFTLGFVALRFQRKITPLLARGIRGDTMLLLPDWRTWQQQSLVGRESIVSPFCLIRSSLL
jgi:hypothetical protein